MARNRRGGRGISNHHIPTANRPTVARPLVRLVAPTPIIIPPDPIADRRRFTMDRTIAPLHAVNRNATRVVVDRFGESVRSLNRLQFAVPKKVTLCVRRKRRKEVIFAKNKAGAGIKRRRPRRNFWSRITC